MQYNLDSAKLTIEAYRELLKNQNLLPGRRLLWHNIDQNFDAIKKAGIDNIAQLKKQLASPKKLASFALATGIGADYLTLLKRETGSLEQKPVPLSSFPNADGAQIDELAGKGIRTSKDYFENCADCGGELFCLCDLVRINGVGAIAAKAFYEAGYHDASQVAQADAAIMLECITRVNEAKHYYKASLGARDMQFCIDFAALLIKYQR